MILLQNVSRSKLEILFSYVIILCDRKICIIYLRSQFAAFLHSSMEFCAKSSDATYRASRSYCKFIGVFGSILSFKPSYLKCAVLTNVWAMENSGYWHLKETVTAVVSSRVGFENAKRTTPPQISPPLVRDVSLSFSTV